jgi:hypothetical protein
VAFWAPELGIEDALRVLHDSLANLGKHALLFERSLGFASLLSTGTGSFAALSCH